MFRGRRRRARNMWDKGASGFMIYFTIVFLCTAGLFLTLLEDRYRIWTTVGVTAGVYILSLLAAFVIRRIVQEPVLAEQLPCAVGSLLFLAASFFLYTNNPAQKVFVALLAQCNFAFLGAFVPLLLGALPFSTAGAAAGVISVALTFLFTLLMGLCLYRPLHHFSDRGVSGFLAGMGLLLCFLYPLCLGKFDFLFRTNIFAARFLLAVVLYGAMIFAFRCLYQAGRFRERTATEAARSRMMEMESGDFADMLAAVREVKAAQKSGEYALDTVTVMLGDGLADQVPAYIVSAKKNAALNPILQQYHENPYLNAVIATKAAFASQNGISFACSAATGETPLKTAELCMLVNEMLTRACLDAAAYPGPRKLRFTVIPGEDAVRFEAVYSADPPVQERFTLKGKKLSDVLQWLFDDSPQEQNDLRGLDNTGEIISRYSGKLEISGAPGETILQAAVRY